MRCSLFLLLSGLSLAHVAPLISMEKTRGKTKNNDTVAISEAELKLFQEIVHNADAEEGSTLCTLIRTVSAAAIVNYVLPRQPSLATCTRDIVAQNKSVKCILMRGIASDFSKAVYETLPENDTAITLKEKKRLQEKIRDYAPEKDGIFPLEL